jgi:hypothetical protein
MSLTLRPGMIARAALRADSLDVPSGAPRPPIIGCKEGLTCIELTLTLRFPPARLRFAS